MIEAHTLDAWTSLAGRSTPAFRYLNILGGLAAPLFLWLAGVALVLAADSKFRATGDRQTAHLQLIRRGLEIFVLAFLFRVQALLLTPGSPLITLFRVDILNVMGASIVAAGLVWGLVQSRVWLVVSYALLTTIVAMITPIVRETRLIGMLPVVVQWYIRPAGEYTTFTLLPWAGFVFAGAAVGAVLAGARDSQSERRANTWLGAAGGGLMALGVYTAAFPSIYAVSSFWTSSPTYFFIRCGLLMLVLGTLPVLAPLARRLPAAAGCLERFGRGSLFIYWIHVELVYGYATWPLRHRLALWQTAVAYFVFCALMYGALILRDRLLTTVRTRSSGGSPSMIRI
jgi:uncharacterized membrane protein